MYLKQKGLTISGSKAELIDQVLTHARGNLSARDAVEDEESPNSCEDDTSLFASEVEIQQVNYSGTPPYDHPVITTTFLWREQKPTHFLI